jgi:DNA processing protein
MPMIAIVGTRHPTTEGFEFARELARQLAVRDVAVISGGALGIDTAAHLGALDVEGVTVVVAPAAFDRPYPEVNAPLFRRIVDSGGAYATSYPPGTPALPGNFFVRNAHLAALSHAVVVVESGLRGGARNATKAARALSRPVFVVPGHPWNSKALGCIAEIRLGASLLISWRDVLAELGVSSDPAADGPDGLEGDLLPVAQTSKIPQSCSGDPDRDALVTALAKGPRNADELCSLTGVSAGRIQALILTLTLEGIVVSDPSGLIHRRTH